MATDERESAPKSGLFAFQSFFSWASDTTPTIGRQTGAVFPTRSSGEPKNVRKTTARTGRQRNRDLESHSLF